MSLFLGKPVNKIVISDYQKYIISNYIVRRLNDTHYMETSRLSESFKLDFILALTLQL